MNENFFRLSLAKNLCRNCENNEKHQQTRKSLNPAGVLTTLSSQARFPVVLPAMACGGQVDEGVSERKKINKEGSKITRYAREDSSSLLVAYAIASGAYAKASATACDGARRGASINRLAFLPGQRLPEV